MLLDDDILQTIVRRTIDEWMNEWRVPPCKLPEVTNMVVVLIVVVVVVAAAAAVAIVVVMCILY
jgi:hypothetical protein